MCQIASLFFLQKLKGSMSGDACVLTTWRCELSSSFFFPPLQGKVPKEIYAILTETLGEYAPPYATIRN